MDGALGPTADAVDNAGGLSLHPAPPSRVEGNGFSGSERARSAATVRTVLVRATKTALYTSGGLSLLRRVVSSRTTLSVLAYHSVSETGWYRSGSLAVSPALFERQMAFLARHYRVLTLDEVVDCIERGRPFPPSATAITFDDGYLDNFTTALPILVRYGLTATFFVTAGPVALGQRFWVSWLRHAIMTARDLRGLVTAGLVPRDAMTDDPQRRERIVTGLTALVNRSPRGIQGGPLEEIAQVLGADGMGSPHAGEMLRPEHLCAMVRAGMTIGSHTVSHPNLPSLTAADAFAELGESRRLLERIIDGPVRHLAYPGGPDPRRPTFTWDTIGLARRAGYRSASASAHAPTTLASDPLALGRYTVSDDDGFAGFVFRLEQGNLERFVRRSRMVDSAGEP